MNKRIVLQEKDRFRFLSKIVVDKNSDCHIFMGKID